MANNEDGGAKSEGMTMSTGLGMGLCFGVVFGMLFNNLALGIGMGMALGIAVYGGAGWASRRSDDDTGSQS